ncbi:hypothetical protein [Ferriphaselus amnicola]|uniref:hypothetical protein n=1 Tax=Ferriphaselus amnicola TaxID=1188319 RepID=UPI001E342CEB|nr:hypothetical protein [Ferriphaselus amnicola]
MVNIEATASSLSFGQAVVAKIASQIGAEINNITSSSNTATSDTKCHPMLLIIKFAVGMTIIFSPIGKLKKIRKKDDSLNSRVYLSSLVHFFWAKN